MLFKSRVLIERSPSIAAWKMVFESLWKTFNLRFQAILESLRRHRDLVDQEANAINIAESKLWRDEQLKQIRQWRVEHDEHLQKTERERLATQMREAVTWLNATHDQEDVLAKLSRKYDGTEGHWALKERTIVSFIDSSRDSPVVWLNGKPGAGESDTKSLVCILWSLTSSFYALAPGSTVF